MKHGRAHASALGIARHDACGSVRVVAHQVAGSEVCWLGAESSNWVVGGEALISSHY